MSHPLPIPVRDPDLVPDVFLAGGIRGCPDWQQDAVDLLTRLNVGSDVPELMVANPRRPGDLATTGNATVEQITWEHEMLQRSRVTMFWFCSRETQPIVLFELGKALGRGDEVIVGVDPGYPRAFDVRIQYLLSTGKIPDDTLEETVRRAHGLAVSLHTETEDDARVRRIARQTSRNWALTLHILGEGPNEDLTEEQNIIRTALHLQSELKKARQDHQTKRSR